MPIFLAKDVDIEGVEAAPSRSVDALEREMLGVDVEELDPYTYEDMFPTRVGSAHFTETEETKAWNWFPAEV
jgi:hypothetical protein